METMRYSETKKSMKFPIFCLSLFLIIGTVIIVMAIKNEPEPQIVGSTEIQRLVEVDTDSETESKNNLNDLKYIIKDRTISDTSNKKIKSNMILPEVYINGQESEDLNAQIEAKFTGLFDALKEKMASADNKFTFKVTYKSYENIVGDKKILSLTLYQRIIDDEGKNATTEKVETYNIDLAKNEFIKSSEIISDILGNDYKDLVKNSVKDNVVSKKMVNEKDFIYAYTGLENFYIKEGEIHLIFNEEEIVDKKYSVLDIVIEKK